MSDIIPLLPRPLRRVARAVPATLQAFLLRHLLRAALKRHPGLLERLGCHGSKRFLIAPADLPVVLLITPGTSDLRVCPQDAAPAFDARIAGPLAAFLGLVHGTYDGDALFFSRDLVVEGDTEAVLALRNAIDDAEIDLSREILAALGRLGALAEPALRRAMPLVERVTGVALSRKTGAAF